MEMLILEFSIPKNIYTSIVLTLGICGGIYGFMIELDNRQRYSSKMTRIVKITTETIFSMGKGIGLGLASPAILPIMLLAYICTTF